VIQDIVLIVSQSAGSEEIHGFQRHDLVMICDNICKDR
jgi:hypothetical protein